ADQNLNLGSVTEADSDAPQGSVIRQSPTANTSVDAGSRVGITISNGRVPVPGVVGKSEAQAKSDLANAGFQVNVTTQADGQEAPGTVLAQSPLGGSTAVKGTLVTITVATAPSPTPSPTTASPTTAAPTTAAPTTAEPTTVAPTTAGPTDASLLSPDAPTP
ncbi:MAG: eukaryotic-like serine/threonine-protein kinase, partial [Actinomycetota bacterium]|nr:eukaryotic-like serine/threonine-protein kinase [Actinomycetota bacterium]